MFFRRIFYIFLVSQIGFFAWAQSAESERLLGQAQKSLYFNPEETIIISTHIYQVGKTDQEKLQALYLKALAFYVKGQFDKGLEAAFQTQEHAITSKDKNFEIKSKEVIDQIFNHLELQVPNFSIGEVENPTEVFFIAENYLGKGKQYLHENNLDAAKTQAKIARVGLKYENEGWLDAQYYNLNGEIFFKKKQMDSALLNFQKAYKISQKLDNQYFMMEVTGNLAQNYLVIDSIERFREYTLLAQQSQNEAQEIEKKASELSHTLLNKYYDSHLKLNQSRFHFWVLLVYGCIGLGILLKIIFYFRNRNKLKMYQNLLRYLKSKEEVAPVLAADFTEKETEKIDAQKNRVLLKESEDEILWKLEKFESSKKFTHKDMSLGMLAAQLNTNTKYLSDVINRQKGKNFNAYINELRINYITTKIKSDPNYLKFKVSYLAEECGFSSHSIFTKVFKSVVGVSPITFVEFVKEEMDQEKLEPVYE